LWGVRLASDKPLPNDLPIIQEVRGYISGISTLYLNLKYVGNAHIILCGRNKQAAEDTIATFPNNPNARYEFVQCDATLLKNVTSAVEELKSKVGAINYLVLSQGGGYGVGRPEPTTEGLDPRMVLHFYSRWKFVDELLPLLRTASDRGEESRVFNILAAGYGTKVNTDDLGMKKSYDTLRANFQLATYNDLFVQVKNLLKFPEYCTNSISSCTGVR
jgi:NAD(P)-dependent dehydrogenase (short-subunit alcohol dehydrogenase family)